MVGKSPDPTSLESREPSAEDLAQICEWLNVAGAWALLANAETSP